MITLNGRGGEMSMFRRTSASAYGPVIRSGYLCDGSGLLVDIWNVSNRGRQFNANLEPILQFHIVPLQAHAAVRRLDVISCKIALTTSAQATSHLPQEVLDP
jgi:hypothetical protein